MTGYIRTPFALDGDRGTIPNDVQPDGSISYDQGFGVDYQLDPDTDPSALNIPRLQFNQLMYAMSLAIQIQQQHGFPDFITVGENGGVPFPYDANATVRFSGVNYYSLIDNNTDTPPSTNWGIVSYTTVTEPTGVGKDFWGITLPSGYIWANGTTIGSGASGATGRANADTLNLFTLLWASCTNTVLPIQDSSGVASTRGISAAADFAANKRLPTPDKRDLVSAGAGNMGGTPDRGLITISGSGISGTTVGASGGVETVQLTSNQNGTHTHTAAVTDPGHTHALGPNGVRGYTLMSNFFPIFTSAGGGTGVEISINSAVTGVTVINNSSGLGSAHQNTQPTIICNYIIKL